MASECRVPNNSKERQESLPQSSMQKNIEENNRMGKTGDLVKKKRSKKQRRKGKIFPLECRVTKNSKER